MSRKKRQCSAQKGTETAPAAFGIVSSVCLPSVIYLSLKLLTWATENSHLKSLLTFISVKNSLHSRSSQSRSSSVGLLLGCQCFKPLGHTCASGPGQQWSDTITIWWLQSSQHKMSCWSHSSSWWADVHEERGKKKHCHCNWYGLAPWLEALTVSQKLNTLGCKGVENFFSIPKASRVVLMHFGRTNWGSSPGCCLFCERKEEFSF